MGVGPCGLCFGPAHDRVYVANSGSSSISVIRSSPPGIEESFGLKLPKPSPLATRVRGVLFLAANGEGRMARGELLDVSGRKVMDLHPGANDVSSLSPGVYFVRQAQAQAQAQAAHKVVLTK